MTFDEQLQRVLDTFTSRLHEEVTERVRLVGDELAAAARVDQIPMDRAPATRRLADAIRAMSGARSLSEVLDTLVSGAGQEATRAGVLLVRGDRFQGWRFLGFDPSIERGDALSLAHRDAGVIGQAIQGAAVTSPGPNGDDGAPAFAQLPRGRACAAVPISIGNQVVAVLYADIGLEPAFRHAQGALSLPNAGILNPEPLEILARFASQRLEALTAILAARSLAVKADPPAPAPGGSDVSADEYAAARRYARLLVSEIKLYHASQVAEGQRERDLATRLGGEIARVRRLYEQRISVEVRQKTDYVHEELIRTLADGDASLLEVKT